MLYIIAISLWYIEVYMKLSNWYRVTIWWILWATYMYLFIAWNPLIDLLAIFIWWEYMSKLEAINSFISWNCEWFDDPSLVPVHVNGGKERNRFHYKPWWLQDFFLGGVNNDGARNLLAGVGTRKSIRRFFFFFWFFCIYNFHVIYNTTILYNSLKNY